MVAFSERATGEKVLINVRQNRRVWLGLLFMAGVLGPPISLRYSLPDVRLDEILLLLVVVGSLFRFPLFELGEKHLRTTTLIFGAFAISVMLSTVYAGIFLKSPYSLRDLTEYITLGKFWLVYVFAANWQNIDKKSLMRLGVVVMITAYLIAVFSFGQLYNVANLNTWLTPYYTAPIQMAGLIGGLHRTVGTFGNPNVWGFFMMMILTFQVAWLYHQVLDFRSWKLYAQLVLLFIGLMALFMTLSRGAVLVEGVILVYLSLTNLFRNRWNSGSIVIISLTAFVSLVALFMAPQSFLFRMAEGAHFTTSTSVAGRMEQWGTAWELIRQSPIFGWGTAKAFLTTIVDNEYILIMRRYGLIGLTIFVVFWINFARNSFKLMRKTTDPVVQTLGEATFAITIGILIFDTSSGIFYNLQVMPIYLLMMGISHSWLHFKEVER